MNWEKISSISFDIFDTLLRRKVETPDEVFLLVERIIDSEFFQKTHFYKLRLDAKKMMKQKNRFYNIDDIYECIGLDSSIKHRAKELEKEIEIEICYPNGQMLSVYERIRNTGKPIYLISDMYLDRNTITQMLDKCGIKGYSRLYISQEENCEKLGGDLYKKVINQNNIQPGHHIHLGDNFKSDIISARLCGMNTYRVGSEENSFDYYSDMGLSTEEKREYGILQRNVALGAREISNEWKKIGYECLGPLLWGFSNWLAHELLSSGIKKVYFLTREGELLERAFRTIYNREFECHYLYVSRRSLMVPSFYFESGYRDIVDKFSFPKTITVAEFLDYLGIDWEKAINEIQQAGFQPTESINGWQVAENSQLEMLYSLIKDKAHIVYREQYDLVQRYLTQEEFSGKVAIVDVGWNCTMQHAIEQLSRDRDVDVYGYYFGVNEKNKLKKNSKAKGYIYGNGKNVDYQYYIMGMSGPLEMMMTAHHGTTVAYTKAEGKVVPVLGESEYFGKKERREACAIDFMQEGALCFIKKLIDTPHLAKTWISGKVAFQNFYLFGKRPIQKHRELFYGMKEYDSKVEFTMLNPEAKGIHGQHSLLKGFWNSSWKIGYMVDKFVLPLPYHEIYKLMRKRKR